MSLTFRIIPKLDIKSYNLVKGINLEGLRVLGSPEIYAEHYYKQGADEIFYQDVVASLYGRNNLTDIIKKTIKNIFIPLTVGGGIKNLQDIENILKSGADRVSINSAAIKNPKFVKEAVKKFGSSTIVISIEAIKQKNGEYNAFTHNGRENSKLNVLKWIKKIEDLGAGEIFITSVDRDGTGQGFDIFLANKVSKISTIPIIFHGGAGKMKDILKLINESKVNGVSLSSILHYDFLSKSTYRKTHSIKTGNVDYLSSKRLPSNIKENSIINIKKFLKKNKVICS